MIGAKSKYTGINGRSKDALRDLNRFLWDSRGWLWHKLKVLLLGTLLLLTIRIAEHKSYPMNYRELISPFGLIFEAYV